MDRPPADGLNAILLATVRWEELRTLLEAPQADAWGLALRFPDRIADGLLPMGDRVHVVSVHHHGLPVACGVRAVQTMCLNGATIRLGWLGLLRRSPRLPSGLIHHALAAAFATLETTRREDEWPGDVTAIMHSNLAAKRVLAAHLPGCPSYHLVSGAGLRLWRRGSLATKGKHGRTIRLARPDDRLPEDSRLTLVPAPPASRDGLWVVEDAAGIAACGKLAPAVRRPVINAQPRILSYAAPIVQVVRRLAGLPGIPRIGVPIELDLATDWRWREDAAEAAAALLRFLAGRPGAVTVAAMWADDHPDAVALNRHLPRATVSQADWFGVGGDPPAGPWHREAWSC